MKYHCKFNTSFGMVPKSKDKVDLLPNPLSADTTEGLGGLAAESTFGLRSQIPRPQPKVYIYAFSIASPTHFHVFDSCDHHQLPHVIDHDYKAITFYYLKEYLSDIISFGMYYNFNPNLSSLIVKFNMKT
jgi:hypothetical protein